MSTKIRTASAVLGLSLLPSLAFAVPAHAAGDSGKQAIVVADAPKCTGQSQGSWKSGNDVVRAFAMGDVVTVTGKEDGVDREYDWYRQVRTSNGKTCWLDASALSEALPGALDPSSWKKKVVVVDGASIGAGEVLSASDAWAVSAPVANASTLSELTGGQILTVADWDVEGGTSASIFSGVEKTRWTPTSIDGVVAWVKSQVLVEVPTLTAADLTSTLTPTRDVDIYDVPSTGGEILGALPAGKTVQSQATPTAGFLPVLAEGQVGWVSQKALLAAETSSASPSVEPTTSASPGIVDGWKSDYETWKSDRAEKKAEKEKAADTVTDDDRTWLQRVSDTIHGRNPVAEAAAKGRLYIAGALGIFAVLLAALAFMTSKAASKIRLKSLLTDIATGGIKPLVVHGSLLAAPVAGLASAYLLPRHYYDPQALGIAVVVGGALAAGLARRVAALRHADDLIDAAKKSSTVLLLAGGGAGALLAYSTHGGLAVAVVAGLAVAGIGGGIAAPKTKSITPEPVDPATPTSAVEPEMEHLS